MHTFVFFIVLSGVATPPLTMGRPQVYLKEVYMYVDPVLAAGNISLFNNTEVTIHVTLKEVIEAIKLNMLVYMSRGTSRFHHVLNETFDYCDTKMKINRNQVWGMIYSTLPSVVPKTCPIQPTSFVVQNYSFPNRFFPLKFPRLNFKFQTEFIHMKNSRVEKVLVGFNGTGKIWL